MAQATLNFRDGGFCIFEGKAHEVAARIAGRVQLDCLRELARKGIRGDAADDEISAFRKAIHDIQITGYMRTLTFCGHKVQTNR